MKPADEREEVLFREALQRPKGAERDAFLDRACTGNEALRARLVALLQAHDIPDPFLEPQAASPGKATVRLPVTEKPGDKIGHYKLLQQIGEGGCGTASRSCRTWLDGAPGSFSGRPRAIAFHRVK